MKDWILLTILAAAVALGLLIWAITSGGSGAKYERLRELELPVTLRPATGEVAPSSVSAPKGDLAPHQQRKLKVYLDVSESMAGYLRVGEGAKEASFRTVAHLVPDHLLRLYGPIEEVDWVAVDNRLLPFDDEPRFSKAEFRGSETYLDLAVEEGFALLASGDIAAFALVTDLVATREVSGALGLYNAIRGWLLSSPVRRGSFDMGLLGVRIPFRGVSNGKCQPIAGLGCWYSERGRGWRPLNAVAERPLYILIIGRSGLGDPAAKADGSLVQRSGSALLEDVINLGLEARWELLTRLSRQLSAALHCTASDTAGKGQFALLRDSEGRYRCQQDQRVKIACQLAPGDGGDSLGPLPIHLEPTSVGLSWSENLATTKLAGGRIEVEVDCGELRDEKPAEALRFTSFVVKSAEPAAGWVEWSVESDEQEEQLNRTLQLRHFIAGTRPERFEVVVDQPLLGKGQRVP